MQVTEYIVNRFKNFVGKPMLVGVCGRAGSGKTTISNKIADELREAGINSIAYSGDWRFKLDSAGRKIHFQKKWAEGLEPYLLAINQFNWWDLIR